MTLSERDFFLPPSEVPSDFEPALAQTRLERWRQESGLDDPELFARRLAQDGLDAERFQHLVGSAAPELRETEGADAPWLELLQSAYPGDVAESPEAASFLKSGSLKPGALKSGSLKPGALNDAFPTEAAAESPEGVFIGVLKPLMDVGWRRLLGGLEDLEIAHVEAAAFAELWSNQLPEQLLSMCSRTLILELYIRRLEGSLQGSTPEQRFASFIDPLGSRAGALEFWSQYPVLARSVAVRVEQWIETGLELAERLAQDAADLEQIFGVGGGLKGLDAGLGDRHDGGRTVVILEFGNGRRVVYKPRSLALDIVFQDLLRWLGKQGLKPGLRPLDVLDRGTYGWVEFVVSESCQSEEEVERFYRRQGIYLALLFALEATDFHHENVIAAGEHPVLIDLESLFQPALLDESSSREDVNPVATTVLRSGLLPRNSWGEQGSEGVDLSGLGAETLQRVQVRELVGVGTDEMSFAEAWKTMRRGEHRPLLNGEEVSLWRFRRHVLEGFESTYRRLAELRQHFLKPGGWLDRFSGLETRIIPRPTGLYIRLLHLSYHPDHLQDGLHREKLVDKLWFDAARFPYIPELIAHEKHDVWRGDVPRFSSRTDSSDLISSTGAAIRGALAETGLSLSRRRFESLDERDLERQLALATMAFAAIRPPGPVDPSALSGAAVGPDFEEKEAGKPVESSELLAAARRVGERLELLSYRSEGWASWFHLRPAGAGPQLLEPVDSSLYSGLGGIAIFLAQLGKQSGESRFPELARAALAVGRERFQRQPMIRQNLGAYAGVGGWIYALTYLGSLLEDESLFAEASEASRFIRQALPQDEALDLIGGAAGSIVALLRLHARRPEESTLDLAKACGEHLLRKAEPQNHGLAWPIASIAALPLTGFAHGVAGIAWALALLAEATGEERFHDAANDALIYERQLFSPEHRNWPDLREDRREGGEHAYFHAWCHGAPGIGLSRLDLLANWRGDRLGRVGREAEIKNAVESTMELGFGESHCLCHGDLGNLELLSRFVQAPNHSESESARVQQGLRRAARFVLTSIERGGYQSGANSRAELPGMMTGLAGIGYGLLKLATPDVPSVLLLELPGR